MSDLPSLSSLSNLPSRFRLPDGYGWQWGSESDRPCLEQWLVAAYAELHPEQASFVHLTQTVAQYWSGAAGLLFWITQGSERVAVVWQAMALDQVTGDRYPHVLLLRVLPTHRRRGLGTALMQAVQYQAECEGYGQVGLQTFSHNAGAIAFYQHLGYQVHSVLLTKPLCNTPRCPGK
ncbi:MAG: GNAT family N-acetyltransferase [Spirulinaceae cyanobacterium]